MVRRVGAWLLVVLAAGIVSAAQQTARDATPPRPGSASIEGTLVAIDSGRPVRRARVSLTSVGGTSVGQSVTTDDLGVFTFKDLSAGTYTLTASKPGYLESIYGQRRPGTGRPGTPIQLADGQHLEKLTFQLARGGAIMGTVVDEQGEPVFGQQVRVYRYTRKSGERTLQSTGTDVTDDRGQFRIPVLLPGEYIVSTFPRESPSDAAVEDLKRAAESLAISARAAGDEQVLVKMKEDIARARDIKADETSESYAPVYYPGTTQASGAQSIMIEVGQERAGVDFQLQLVRTAKITGVVSAPDGSPNAVTSTVIALVDADQIVPGVTARTARPGPDGRFTIGGVPPGHYTLFARAAPVMSRTLEGPTADSPAVKSISTFGATQFWAMDEIVVDGRNVPDLAVTLQKGTTVSGVVRTDASGGQTFDLARVRVSLSLVGPAGLGNLIPDVPATADAGGRFSISGVVPGKYRVSVGGPPAAWTPKSAVFNGRDALDFFVEVKPGEDQSGVITLTTHPGTLSGMLQDSSGQPTAAYTIIVFPPDERLWASPARRILATRPATDGRYSLSGLPAGDYRLVAVTDVEPGQWYDPAFLRELLGMALPITITDGERRGTGPPRQIEFVNPPNPPPPRLRRGKPVEPTSPASGVCLSNPSLVRTRARRARLWPRRKACQSTSGRAAARWRSPGCW